MMGLSGKHHKELNTLHRQSPIYDELRKEYAGDKVAQQQIDVYDPDSAYFVKFCEYRDALMKKESSKIAHLTDWFKKHYPDL